MESTLVVYIPPWVVLAALVGFLHGALFHLLFGQHVGQLFWQVVLGLAAGLLGGLVGIMIPPAVLAIGDTNLIASTAGAWAALGIARMLRIC